MARQLSDEGLGSYFLEMFAKCLETIVAEDEFPVWMDPTEPILIEDDGELTKEINVRTRSGLHYKMTVELIEEEA